MTSSTMAPSDSSVDEVMHLTSDHTIRPVDAACWKPPTSNSSLWSSVYQYSHLYLSIYLSIYLLKMDLNIVIWTVTSITSFKPQNLFLTKVLIFLSLTLQMWRLIQRWAKKLAQNHTQLVSNTSTTLKPGHSLILVHCLISDSSVWWLWL
jgi:hypothetical protein